MKLLQSKKTKWVLVVTILTLSLFAHALNRPIDRAIQSIPSLTEEVRRLPNTTFKSISNQVMTHHEYKNKVLVINFWATWCGPCKLEIPGLIKLRKSYSEDELVIIGVSLDTDEAIVQRFSESIGINYPIVMNSQTIQSSFGSISAIPTTYIIDKDNIISQRLMGYEPYKVLDELVSNELNKKRRVSK